MHGVKYLLWVDGCKIDKGRHLFLSTPARPTSLFPPSQVAAQFDYSKNAGKHQAWQPIWTTVASKTSLSLESTAWKTFPKTQVQLCIVQQIRNSIRYAASRDQKEFINELKPVYQASTKKRQNLSQIGLKRNEHQNIASFIRPTSSNRSIWNFENRPAEKAFSPMKTAFKTTLYGNMEWW